MVLYVLCTVLATVSLVFVVVKAYPLPGILNEWSGLTTHGTKGVKLLD